MKMETPGTPHTPQKQPSKTIEVIKKAARILAVGSTLANTAPANAKNVEAHQNTPNNIVNTEFAILHGEDPDYVMRPTFAQFRKSTNVEDMRNAPRPETALYGIHGVSTEPEARSISEDELATVISGNEAAVGPYDKDIEDAAKRIEAEVAAEKAAKIMAEDDNRVLFDKTPLGAE